MERTRLERMMVRHEGYRQHMYKCTAAKTTIGYGYNLDAGMPEDEAFMLMRMRLRKTEAELATRIPWFTSLVAERQEVLVNMAYQMGVAGLMGFKKALAAMSRGDWNTAADEMLDSKWARSDSPNRARELALVMRTGKF